METERMTTETRIPDLAEVEAQTMEVVRGLLRELGQERQLERLRPDSSFVGELGLSSLDLVELLVRSEARFGIKLPDSIAEEAETPAAWAKAIVAGAQQERSVERYEIIQPTRPAPPPPHGCLTLLDALRRHVETEPDRVHAHVLTDDGGEDIRFGQLWERSAELAGGLRAAGLQRNDTVAIMLPNGADFLYAYVGAMMAGGVPVPIYPPRHPAELEEYVARQVRVLRQAAIRFLISFDEVRAVSRLLRLNLRTLLEATTVERLREAGVRYVAAAGADLAHVQYTSGSTGDPKGVMVTHANLLDNVRNIGWAVEVTPHDTVVSWLPLCSDMGLVGTWLFSLYHALPLTLLSPLAFLHRPEKWLWAVHHSGGTLSVGPNFAYELCARRVPSWTLEGLDLRSWRVAINAGEMVLPETMRRFAERFAPFGFRAEALRPAYGLAEASVALTIASGDGLARYDVIARHAFERDGIAEPARENEGESLVFYSGGRPLPGHEIRIVDEGGEDVGERVVGRIQFRGPSQTPGYYQNPGATAASRTEDGWMETGDFGYLAGGELYFTGRHQDYIIKSGRKIIPHDVEAVVQGVPGVRQGGVVAFGLEDRSHGTERLIVVAETTAYKQADKQRVENGIRKCVTALLGLAPDAVMLVGAGRIPRTANGRVRRQEARLQFLGGKLTDGAPPVWLQLLRLNSRSLRGWSRWRVASLRRRALRLWRRSVRYSVGVAGGALAWLAPETRFASSIVRGACRLILRLSGEQALGNAGALPAATQPVVYLSNREGLCDPVLLAALLPAGTLFLESGAPARLPRPLAWLMGAVMVPTTRRALTPEASLTSRITRLLGSGYSLASVPEGPPGASARRSRFRREILEAAIAAGATLVPLGLRGTAAVLQEDRRGRQLAPSLICGPAIPAGGEQDPVALRVTVREALAHVLSESAPAGASVSYGDVSLPNSA